MNDQSKERFEKAATQGSQGLIVEYLRFLFRNKKYWLIPVIVVLLAIGLIGVLGGSTAGAFIYTIF